MFRKQRAVKQLSADELKTKLYSHFDKTGSLNRIRTELRGKLVSELLKVAAPLKTSETDEVFLDFDKTLLPLQVTNWLVYDHLLRQGHQYAVSIFVTEANLAQPEKLLTACDILSLFGLDSTTPEYKSISKMYSTNMVHGCSYSLLLAVIKSLFDFSHQEEGLVNKELENIVPRERLDKLSPKRIFLQEKVNKSYDRNEDSESLEFCKKPMGMEDPIVGRNKSDLNEQLQMVIEENKRENKCLRQRFLQELDRLHAQERSQQVEMEHERLRMKKDRDSLLIERENLKEKELLLIKEYENKLERRIRELQTEFATKVHSNDKTLEDLKLKLFEKEQRLEQIDMEFSSQQTNFIVLKKELEDIQKIHKSTHEKYSTLLNDNTNLLKKFENMSDYAVVKDELQVKSQRVSNLCKEIEDITKTSEKEREALTEVVRNVETKLNTQNCELLEAHRQLNVTRDTLHMKETVWNREKRRLEQENLASKDLYRSFSQKLEEQKGDIQALHQTIHLLHYQLTDKDTGKMYEPPVRQKIAFTTSDRTNNEQEVFRINRKFKESPPKYKDSSLKFIEDAKNKIFKLQQQEDELQDKCSLIYSSVPELNTQFLTSHLAFNSARAQSNAFVADPIHRFSSNSKDNFRNLIGNEMPTLDLSFPEYIKNSLASTFTDITAVKSPEISTKGNVSLNNPTNVVLNSNKNINTSTLRLEQDLYLKDTKTEVPKYGSNGQASGSLPSQRLDSAEYSNNKEKVSQNLTLNNSIKTNQTQVNTLEKDTTVVSSLEKEVTITEKSFPPVGNEIPKRDFQAQKLMPLTLNKNISSSRVQEGSRSSSALVSDVASEDLKPDAFKQTSDISTKDSENLPYYNPNKLVTEAPKDTDSKTASIHASHSESVQDVPIVVDLDAAWKRKSSLQHESSVKPHSLEQDTIKNTLVLDSSITKISPPKSTSEEPIYSAQNNTDAQNVDNTDQSVLQIESFEQAESINPKLHQDIPETVGRDYLTTEFVHKDSSRLIDEESTKDAVSESKNDEDSLSEIHFSYGSEQEQQTEDSDNW